VPMARTHQATGEQQTGARRKPAAIGASCGERSALASGRPWASPLIQEVTRCV
jgi:hypothetical protein